MPHLESPKETMGRRESNIWHKRGKPKGKKPTEGKGNGKSAKFAFLVPIGNGPIGEEEVAGGQVNVDIRQINLANALGADGWERKNDWPEERSSIIDTGFDGGGLRSFAWLRKYPEYLRSFYPKAKLIKTRGY